MLGDLYTKHNTDKITQRELLSYVNRKITPTERAFCDEPVSLMQLEIAVEEIPLHKSPGLDGLPVPVEFYVSKWETLKLDFYELVNEISKHK